MRRVLTVILVLGAVTPMYGQDSGEFSLNLDQPIHEIMLGIGEVTPPFALGVEATYLYFPWGISASFGGTILLGVGANAGFYIEFEDGVNPFRLVALFDGRFPFSDRVALDIDTGLGVLLAGSGAAFMGTVGVGVPIGITDAIRLRPYVGADFGGNANYDPLSPYSKSLIIWLHAAVTVMFSLGATN